MTRPTSSLLVTTYNWPQALAAVLASLRRQTVMPDEVLVADDGSGPNTWTLIESLAQGFPVPLRHVWQEDRGFRAASCRNRAIAASRGSYVIMLDGDMVVHPSFVADHLAFAEPGTFLQGGRLQASAALTGRLLSGARPRFHPWMDVVFNAPHGDERRHTLRISALARRKANGAHAGVTVMSCNFSAWRADLIAANGFDERMEGYGSEDLELDVRLRNAGLRRKRLKHAALAVHLAHRTRAPEDLEDLSLPNNRILSESARSGVLRCEQGLNRYL